MLPEVNPWERYELRGEGIFRFGEENFAEPMPPRKASQGDFPVPVL
jgi:hypothetical protein